MRGPAEVARAVASTLGALRRPVRPPLWLLRRPVRSGSGFGAASNGVRRR